MLISDEDDATTSAVNLEEAGKRVIFINQQQPQKYCNNSISTAKYRLVILEKIYCIKSCKFSFFLSLQCFKFHSIILIWAISSLLELFLPLYCTPTTNTRRIAYGTLYNIGATDIHPFCQCNKRDCWRLCEFYRFFKKTDAKRDERKRIFRKSL